VAQRKSIESAWDTAQVADLVEEMIGASQHAATTGSVVAATIGIVGAKAPPVVPRHAGRGLHANPSPSIRQISDEMDHGLERRSRRTLRVPTHLKAPSTSPV